MICIAWGGLPSYAACAVRCFIEQHPNERVTVVATASDVPKTSKDEVAGVPVHWVSDDDERTIQQVVGSVPDILVVSGWFIPSFNGYVQEVRSHGGGCFAIVDNIPSPGIQGFVRRMKVRLAVSQRFAGFIVPGKSGEQHLRSCGIPEHRIATGAYTADPTIFFSDSPLSDRRKEMLYVGRFTARKNILRVAKAFADVVKECPGWRLRCFGCGEQEDALRMLARQTPAIVIEPFSQPEHLAEAYRRARCFVLGSLDEHWGVVVHEAALSGCYLLLSERIGARPDLATSVNSSCFDPLSGDAIRAAFKRATMLSDSELEAAQAMSLALAHRISPENFSTRLGKLLGLN